MQIAPKPGDGQFTLSMQATPATLNAELLDATSRSIRTFRFNPLSKSFTATLNLTDLPNASYLLRLTDGKRLGAVWLSIVD